MVSKKEKAQVLLIVILVVVVTLTVGLSLASKSVINLNASVEEAQSQKALSAAEAGIERALKTNTTISSNFGTDSSYEASIIPVGGSTDPDSQHIVLNGGNPVSKNEGIDVWFEEHDQSSGELINDYTDPSSAVLYWGTPGVTCGGAAPTPAPTCNSVCTYTPDCPVGYICYTNRCRKLFCRYDPECQCFGFPTPTPTPVVIPIYDVPAVEVIVITVPSSVFPHVPGTEKTYRYVYDACYRNNGFDTAVSTGDFTVNSTHFGYKTPANNFAPAEVTAGNENIVFMRVIPVYKDTAIGITNDNSLPSQGVNIESTGSSGDANRKIKVFRGWPQTYLPYMTGLWVVD